ncbi:MAG: pyroglutamyl-peptidase [Planctomycetota bacterium]|jgi:pyroglutamyl-peptidase
MKPLVLVTGFGPFEKHAENPSGEIALGLAKTPPPGVDVVGVVLPVSFRRVAASMEEALAGLNGRRPDLILSLGVHSRPGWRVEGCARVHLTRRGRPDNDGVDAVDAMDVSGKAECEQAPLMTGLDAGALTLLLQELSPEPAGLSWNAGGYVCEWAYAQGLQHAQKLQSNALFVHVPQSHFTSIPVQIERMGGLLVEALKQLL